MKNTLQVIFICLFLTFSNSVHAQWDVVHFDKYSNGENSTIKFLNDSVGFFMSSHSTILRTEDVGDTWNKIDLDVEIHIQDFQFVTDSVFYAIGLTKLIKSTDMGMTWDSVNEFSTQYPSLWFLDTETGFVGGKDGIMKTTDGGENWNYVFDFTDMGYNFGFVVDIQFLDQVNGFAVGRAFKSFPTDYFLLQTTDSGSTWDTILIPFNTDDSPLFFLNTDTGYLGSENSIYKTTDGGQNWSTLDLMLNLHPPSFLLINQIHFISDNIGFAVGGNDIPLTLSFSISKTEDGGDTWVSLDTFQYPLTSVYFLNEDIGFVSGYKELIMRTTNGNITELPEDYPWIYVSIDEKKYEQLQISIFPNPASDEFNFKISGMQQPDKATIKLYDMSGRQVREFETQLFNGHQYIMDISDLQSGNYLLQVEGENYQYQTEKILIH